MLIGGKRVAWVPSRVTRRDATFPRSTLGGQKLKFNRTRGACPGSSLAFLLPRPTDSDLPDGVSKLARERRLVRMAGRRDVGQDYFCGQEGVAYFLLCISNGSVIDCLRDYKGFLATKSPYTKLPERQPA